MFLAPDPNGFVPALPGIERKTLAYGEHTLMTVFRMQKGSKLPEHSHPYEQTGYLVSGKMRMTVAGETFAVEPGSSWCIPGGASHGADILEDTLALEIFSPIREDYLPRDR
jgi:quercetin dioxygenase-like cupin family protein